MTDRTGRAFSGADPWERARAPTPTRTKERGRIAPRRRNQTTCNNNTTKILLCYAPETENEITAPRNSTYCNARAIQCPRRAVSDTEETANKM